MEQVFLTRNLVENGKLIIMVCQGQEIPGRPCIQRKADSFCLQQPARQRHLMRPDE
jgi:hypothetical protein